MEKSSVEDAAEENTKEAAEDLTIDIPEGVSADECIYVLAVTAKPTEISQAELNSAPWPLRSIAVNTTANFL